MRLMLRWIISTTPCGRCGCRFRLLRMRGHSGGGVSRRRTCARRSSNSPNHFAYSVAEVGGGIDRLSARSTSRRKSSSPRASASASGSCVNRRSRITHVRARSRRPSRRASTARSPKNTSTLPSSSLLHARRGSPGPCTISAFDLQTPSAARSASSPSWCPRRPRSVVVLEHLAAGEPRQTGLRRAARR